MKGSSKCFIGSNKESGMYKKKKKANPINIPTEVSKP